MNATMPVPFGAKLSDIALLELGIKFLLSYFIGSLMGSMIIGRLRNVDIRTMGSGNAGGTNALRTQGWLFALCVIVIDVGKGVIATALIPFMELPFIDTDPAISRVWLQVCCAAAVVIGHVWPFFHNFRGGKGAATMLGTMIVLAPAVLLPVLLVWAWVLLLSGYVGLATMLATIAAPIYLAVTVFPEDQPVLIYCIMMALFAIFTHRSNIQRMAAGSEHRNTRLMFFRRNRDPQDRQE